MQLTHILVALMATVPFASALTRAKANEYKDSHCKTWNYGHNSFFLGDTTMADNTHSVYLTRGDNLQNARKNGPWLAFASKGVICEGEQLGELPDGCVNLDTHFKKRIRCLRPQFPK
ncbi:uncharacterized protein ACLA_032050 [Aspergillus clavatus NRRL 1]|uniref:Uncharacterized protein n=1 Tax=Aspergillus clavatus (strain ATCC 1007 / CBS 513.65 / DSM 816 / NCTC 3887 / NRRL 1 / QM 1276 / 107) TaxID=344612 RepID=A1CS49_ASPCL|nr:uncharacterized protein ACLA_032050 [Aspergillus clavatus NRRL 1]EAW08470.1 conserved hypothetical protein [Aspergillus clavatus NRRL 1]